MGGDEKPRLRAGSFRLLDSGAEGGASILTADACTDSEDVAELPAGTIVKVVEVQKVLSPSDGEDRIRGRVQEESGTKGGWISMVDLTNDFSWVEPCDDPPQLGPGTYHIVHDNATVTKGQSTSTSDLGKLAKGTVVEVLEVVAIADEHRIRGRIENPFAGWFSMVKTTNNYCWAEKAAPANALSAGLAAFNSAATAGSTTLSNASAAAKSSASTLTAASASVAANGSTAAKASASAVADCGASAAASASAAATPEASTVTVASKQDSVAAAYRLSIGDVVQARWGNSLNYYDAKIAAFNEDYGTVSVDWDSAAWIQREVHPKFVIKKGQASFVEWEVVHEGGVRVRTKMSKTAAILGQKRMGEKMRGRALGEWLALEDEGFMLVTAEHLELMRPIRAPLHKPALLAVGLVLAAAVILKAPGISAFR